MSDAFTDEVRDGRRSMLKYKFYELMLEYLRGKKTKAQRSKIKATAKKADEVIGGWSDKTNLSEDLDEEIEKLSIGDKNQWAELLSRVMESDLFAKFKALSPFKDSLIVQVDIDSTISVEGEIKRLLYEIIKKNKYEPGKSLAGTYVLVLPELKEKDCEIIFTSK